MFEQRETVRARLLALGFDDVRFAQIHPPSGEDALDQDGGSLRQWLADGNHADMAWLERTLEKRTNPELVLPGARSVIMLGVNYWPGQPGQLGGAEASREAVAKRPIWARYALYADYHDTIKAALVEAGRELERLCGAGERDYRYYVDTGPVLERGWAARAGVGFLGKNAMLISRRFGNWLFLAAILTRISFPPDDPIKRTLSRADGRSGQTSGAPPVEGAAPRGADARISNTGGSAGVGLLCGKCTRCQDACPTSAIPRPGVVDARRCISYQTIENRGIIPHEFRVGIGARIYGCDVCLEVCPWNRFAQESRRVLLSARYDLAELSLREVLELTPERFAEIFRKTAIKRIKLTGLLRNACIVAGNTGAHECADVLEKLARHPAVVVRAHAVWALRRLDLEPLLANARAAEEDPAVLAEYEHPVTRFGERQAHLRSLQAET